MMKVSMPREVDGNAVPGVVHANAVYAVDEFRRRKRTGNAALREAKGRGLKIHRSGNRRDVVGSDWIQYLTCEKSESVPAPE